MIDIAVPYAVAGLFLLFVLIFAIAWAIVLGRGVPYRPVYVGIVSLFYVLVMCLLLTGDWLGLTGVAPLDLILFGSGLVLMAAYSVRTVRVARRADGRMAYRGKPLVVVVWLLIFLLEIYVQVAILGVIQFGPWLSISGFPGSATTPLSSVPHPGQFVLATVDALFALGTGVTVGHNAGVSTAIGRHHLQVLLKHRRQAASPADPVKGPIAPTPVSNAPPMPPQGSQTAASGSAGSRLT
jgi:hypothetical protein